MAVVERPRREMVSRYLVGERDILRSVWKTEKRKDDGDGFYGEISLFYIDKESTEQLDLALRIASIK